MQFDAGASSSGIFLRLRCFARNRMPTSALFTAFERKFFDAEGGKPSQPFGRATISILWKEAASLGSNPPRRPQGLRRTVQFCLLVDSAVNENEKVRSLTRQNAYLVDLND
jgi:hypothetical protein